ncbi:hypothetical protein [Bacillus paranthracis]|uniref:hypothetical protein n=1 Tax=Bacillus paranthracis TaxID=2026186 RepID=UPI002FDC1844
MDGKENKKLITGDKLMALHTEKLFDRVTKDKVYEVTKVTDIGFYIINDDGKECFPVGVRFKRVSE